MDSTSTTHIHSDHDDLFSPRVRDQSREVLKQSPDIQFFSKLDFSRQDWSEQMDKDIKLELDALYKSPNGRVRMTRERELERITQQVEVKYRRIHHEQRACSILWMQSERTLNLLRTKGLTPVPDHQTVQNAMARFVQSLDVDRFPEIVEQAPTLQPNQYFELTQPTLVAGFGYPFYSTLVEQSDPIDDCAFPESTLQCAEQIIGLNTDFWAAFMGGDKRLGHDLVFYLPESKFYFFDLVASCYVPTSDEKVRLVASQAIQRCAWGQEASLAKTILETFRTKKVLDEIITKARSVLAADRGFFEGREAKPRWSEAKKVPDEGVAIATFVKEQIEPADDGILPLGDCLDQLEAIGGVIMSRKEITERIKAAVTSVHHIRLRNDLSLPNGRAVSGWKGLRLRSRPHAELNLEAESSSIRLSANPNSSESSGEQVSDQSSELVLVG